MGHAVRKIAAPPQAVDAMFRQAGVIQVDTLEEMFDVAQLLAHQPLPRGRRVAIVGNSDALGLLAADAAAAVGLVVNKQVALERRARPPEDFEDALDDAIDDPDVDAVVAVYIPPLNVAGEDDRQRAGRRGGAVRQAAGLDVPRRRGHPRAAARPRRRRLHRRPRLGAVVPRGRGRRPRARPRRRVRRVAAHPGRRGARPRRRRPGRGAAGDRPGARRRRPDGVDLDDDALTELLAAYGIELWEARPVATLREAQKAGRELGWDVVLKATAEHLRERPDLAHVWRNIDYVRRDARRLGEPARGRSASPSSAGFVVQKNAPPGVPVAIRSLEDPLFGPVVSFGISGPLIELLARRVLPDPAARPSTTPRRWCARSSSSPMLFGYRGSEVVDVDEVERLIQRVAQLQNDLPQVRALELSLVLAGAARRDRADRRGPGRAGRRPALGLVRPPDAARSRATPSPADARRPRVTDSTPCRSAPPTTRTAASSCATRSTAPATTPRWSPTASSAAVAGERGRVVLRPPRADVRPRRGTPPPDRSWCSRPSRLIIAHTDEHAGDDLLPEPYTSTSTEAIRLSSVTSVVVTRMVANPTKGPTTPAEAVITHRLGRGQPGRPRAGRLRRPAVRGRPRLHRRAGLRRLLAAGLGRRRRPDAVAAPAVVRRAALRPDPHAVDRRTPAFVEPAYGHAVARRRRPGGRRARSAATSSAARRPGWCCPRRRRTSCSSSTGSAPRLLERLRRTRRRTSPRCWPTRRPAPPACRRRPRPA